MTTGIVFGNENAEHDDLLFDCKIEHSAFDPYQHRIISGRWGTGKSAQLLLMNQRLSEELGKLNESDSRIWYINEQDLNFSGLFSESIKYASDMRKFSKILEEIWYPEILRRAVNILGYLDKYYGSMHEEHWNSIRKIYDKTDTAKTLWKQLPSIMKIVTSDNKSEALKDIQSDISLVFQESLFDKIQSCLKDIRHFPIKPVIAIEPLETPNSELDREVSLAQEVIYALLNLFERKFQPSNHQLLDVYIAVPKHRYKLDGINFPQKISGYKYNLQWNREALEKFINERISWEFKRVGRTKFDKKRAWYELFDRSIERDSFEIPIKEDTFDYALRFTHHRPRDIQTLSRVALQVASEITGRTKEEILKGTGGIKIRGSHLRKAIHRYRPDACKLLGEEYRRGNPKFLEVLSIVQGLPARFGPDKLYKKLKDTQNPHETISMLWDAGILGIELYCDKDQQKFEAMLPQETRKKDKNIAGATVTRGYFFEYNFEDDIHDVLAKYKTTDPARIQFVLHPKCYDSLISRQTLKWPIGI